MNNTELTALPTYDSRLERGHQLFTQITWEIYRGHTDSLPELYSDLAAYQQDTSELIPRYSSLSEGVEEITQFHRDLHWIFQGLALAHQGDSESQDNHTRTRVDLPRSGETLRAMATGGVTYRLVSALHGALLWDGMSYDAAEHVADLEHLYR